MHYDAFRRETEVLAKRGLHQVRIRDDSCIRRERSEKRSLRCDLRRPVSALDVQARLGGEVVHEHDARVGHT